VKRTKQGRPEEPISCGRRSLSPRRVTPTTEKIANQALLERKDWGTRTRRPRKKLLPYGAAFHLADQKQWTPATRLLGN